MPVKIPTIFFQGCIDRELQKYQKAENLIEKQRLFSEIGLNGPKLIYEIQVT